MSINYGLKDKLALVTAGSKGIGFAVAYKLLNSSAKVAICSSNAANLVKAKKILIQKFDTKNFLILKFDLFNNKNLNILIKKIENHFGKNIDILVNNCGGPPAKPILKINDYDLDNAIKKNLLSTIKLSQLVANKMIKKKWGRIINLTSTTAKEAAKNMCLSNVTRAGVVAFSKTFSLEFGPFGITSNSILTGPCVTDRFKKLINSKNNNDYEKILKKISKEIPSGYVAQPEEFGNIITFLCSNYSSYINGAAIPVDGGLIKSSF